MVFLFIFLGVFFNCFVFMFLGLKFNIFFVKELFGFIFSLLFFRELLLDDEFNVSFFVIDVCIVCFFCVCCFKVNDIGKRREGFFFFLSNVL